MLYRLTYGADVLHDPRMGTLAEELALTEELGRSATLTAKLAPGEGAACHVEPMDARRELVLWQDGTPIFMGRATSIDTAMDGTVTIKAEDARAYLNDTKLPPYATYAASGWEGEPNAPQDAGELFAWMLEHHNSTCGSALRRFRVGDCAGTGRQALRASSQWPKTLAEMTDKLTDLLGGDIQTSYTPDGTKQLDWLADGRGRAAQTVEFGENLLDFAETREATDIVTAIMPYIKRDKAEAAPLTAEERGSCAIPQGCEWRGSMLVRTDAAEAHGIIWDKRDYECDKAQTAIDDAASDLAAASLGIESIDISALDLSSIDPSVEPIRLLDWVDVRARPLGFNARVMCVKRELDCLDPARTRYTLGATRKTLTNGLTASQTHMQALADESTRSVAALSQEQKSTAQELREGIAGAVIETHEEYALTGGRTVEPGSSAEWSRTPPDPGSGCVWRRTVTTTGDGMTATSEAVPLTGEDGAVIELLPSNGSTFRRKGETTTIHAAVVQGAERMADIGTLRKAFGQGASVKWEERQAGSPSWTEIAATDSRIGDDGFSLTVSEEDVNKDATYRWSVVTEEG